MLLEHFEKWFLSYSKKIIKDNIMYEIVKQNYESNAKKKCFYIDFDSPTKMGRIYFCSNGDIDVEILESITGNTIYAEHYDFTLKTNYEEELEEFFMILK